MAMTKYQLGFDAKIRTNLAFCRGFGGCRRRFRQLSGRRPTFMSRHPLRTDNLALAPVHWATSMLVGPRGMHAILLCPRPRQ